MQPVTAVLVVVNRHYHKLAPFIRLKRRLWVVGDKFFVNRRATGG
jgi:hypothetical protein